MPDYSPKPRAARVPYRWKPKAKGKSQHYELILDGAVRKYHADKREVCQNNRAGRLEYNKRLAAMVQRQGYKCCLQEVIADCPGYLRTADATFEHEDLRGLGGAFRDDRIEDENGNPMNGAAHWNCNVKKGSRRIL